MRSASLSFAFVVSCVVHVAIFTALSVPQASIFEPRSSPVGSLNLSLPQSERRLTERNIVPAKTPTSGYVGTVAHSGSGAVKLVAGSGSDDGYFSPSELDKLASLIDGALSIELRPSATSAVPTTPVKLLILIGADGGVDQVYALSNSDYATQAAVMATNWQFTAAEKDGMPVASRKLVELSFEAAMSFE